MQTGQESQKSEEEQKITRTVHTEKREVMRSQHGLSFFILTSKYDVPRTYLGRGTSTGGDLTTDHAPSRNKVAPNPLDNR